MTPLRCLYIATGVMILGFTVLIIEGVWLTFGRSLPPRWMTQVEACTLVIAWVLVLLALLLRWFGVG